MSPTVSRFFFPDPVMLTAIGRRGIAGVPVLFDGEFRLLHVENRYLRERALLRWQPAMGSRRARDKIAPNTIKTVARHLHHFRDWCDRSRTKGRLETLRYEQVIEYQNQQVDGRGIYDGRPVSGSTANARADVATDFLLWATQRRLRSRPFTFTMNEHKRLVSNARSMEQFLVTTRSRPKRAATAHGTKSSDVLHLPEPEQIGAWLKATLEDLGVAKYWICRFIVDTGVRLHEAVALEVDQWPTLAEIARHGNAGADEVPVDLIVTKSDPRTVFVSIGAAGGIRNWIDGGREELLKIADERGKVPPSNRLFLSDTPGYEGIPIQRHTVYDLFHDGRDRPHGWHPHMARHAFACHFMRDFVATELAADPGGKGATWVDSRGGFALSLLGEQLGHVSKATTAIYLRYLRNSLGMAKRMTRYQSDLDGSIE